MTKIKAAVKLYGNGDPAMAMVREFAQHIQWQGFLSSTNSYYFRGCMPARKRTRIRRVRR